MSASNAQFELACLEVHNKYRALHGCPPLQLSRHLSDYAHEWAQNIASRNTMQHRSNNKYGENIYMAMGGVVNAEQPVKAWYDEITSYNFGSARFSSNTGHFTQVIWKGSKQLGVGIVRRGNNTFVVANYDPPGNMQGSFMENVPRRI